MTEQELKQQAVEAVKESIATTVELKFKGFEAEAKAKFEKIESGMDKIFKASEDAKVDRVFNAMSNDEFLGEMKRTYAYGIVAERCKQSDYSHVRAHAEKKYKAAIKYLAPKITELLEEDGEKFKASMDTVTTGAGLEFLGRIYSTTMTEVAHELATVWGKFPLETYKGGKVTHPKETAEAGATTDIWLQHGANVTATQNTTHTPITNFATGKVDFSTFEIRAAFTLSYKFVLENIVNAMEKVEKSLIRQTIQQVENGILNGAKTTEATLYVGVGVHATSIVKSVDGLRFDGLTDAVSLDFGNAAYTNANMLALRKKMGVFGDDAKSLVGFISRSAFYGALQTIDTNDKVGQLAALVTGELSPLYGVKFQIGGYAMNKSLTTAVGKFDTTTPSNNVRNSLIIVNPSAYLSIQDEGIKIMADFNVLDGSYLFGSHYNWDFKKVQSGVNGGPAAYGYNIIA